MIDETRGVPLHRMEHGVFVPVAAPSLHDHTAYPLAEARLLEAVAEAAGAQRNRYSYISPTLSRVLDALAAHRSAS